MTDAPRILIIEGRDDRREAMAARLRAEGFEVIACSPDQRGLRATADDPIDLILLDMTLPGREGVALYQALRANPSRRAVPVILLNDRVADSHWEAMPYETEGSCVMAGRGAELSLLLARITQLLAEARRE